MFKKKKETAEEVQQGTLVVCRHCGSNACYEHTLENGTAWECVSCGFGTTTLHKEGSDPVNYILETAPELYKDLLVKDEEGCVWYPRTVASEDKGIIFLDGTSAEDVEWTVIRNRQLTEEEQKTEKVTHKSDPSTKKSFGRDFMEAFFYWLKG